MPGPGQSIGRTGQGTGSVDELRVHGVFYGNGIEGREMKSQAISETIYKYGSPE